MDLGDLVQPDDFCAEANRRIHTRKLDLPPLGLYLLDQVDEDAKPSATHVPGSSQVDQEIIRPVLAGDQIELAFKLLALGRESEFLAHDFDDGDVADHVRLDMLKVSGGHDCGSS